METDREEMIRRRAREIWEKEGQPEGRATEHWETATREVDAEMAFAPAAPEPKRKAGRPASSGKAKAAARPRKTSS